MAFEKSKIKTFLAERKTFIGIGVVNVILFHYAIYRLWFFLFDASGRQQFDSSSFGWIVNTLLILFFCLPHSFLLNSKVKKSILKAVPQALYGTIYSLHACLSIVLLDEFWFSQNAYLFTWSDHESMLISFFYGLSWLFMFWSMVETGLFRQSGVEEWWKALTHKKMKQGLLKNGPYQICRHPIYASFLGMIWFTPNMSSDRLFLAISWSVYIFIGAYLKEKRLMKNKGYREYATKVPAFPLMPVSFFPSK